MVVTAIFLRLFTIGYKIDGKKPIVGFRKTVIDWAYWYVTKSIALGSGANVKLIESDCDYSEFLGKDYKKTQVLPKKTSTIVSNH